MKFTKLFSTLILFVSLSLPVFAQEENEEKNLNFHYTVDFAYYPLSAYIANPEKNNSQFAPLTGPYSGLEGRATFFADYTIPTPLGKHWLVKDANLVLEGKFEISPVSVKPGVAVTFTPLPFLVFNAGAEGGTGWTLAGLQGMALFNDTNLANPVYDDLTPFKNWYYKLWAQGSFQFDFGAVIQSKWAHVLTVYTYQVYYEGISGLNENAIWEWQCTKNKTNALINYQNIVLAYQIPDCVLQRVGVLTEIEGCYSDSAYKNPDYDSAFKTVSISPLMQFAFTPKHSLTALIGFSSRRSFAQEHTVNTVEPLLTATGREWFFRRIALSYSQKL